MIFVLLLIIFICCILISFNKKTHNCNFSSNVKQENRIHYRESSFYSSIKGTTFNGAQSILPTLKPGTPLKFYREPTNQYDHNAIRVECNGVSIGHVSSYIAEQYAKQIDQRRCFLEGVVKEITGGYAYKRNYGCNIEIFVYSYSPIIVCTNDNVDPNNPFYGKKCVFYDYGDEDIYELKQLAVNMGATTTQKPSSKTNFYIVGNLDSLSVISNSNEKYRNAIERGFTIEVITISQFKKIANKYLGN